MGTSRAISGSIVPRDVIFIGTLKLPGDQDLALSRYAILYPQAMKCIVHCVIRR